MTAIPTVRGLHHYAARCKDAEETRHFYEDLLGLPLVHVIRADNVPSTGEHCPYVHIFFRLDDGSHIAFFDLGDGQAAAPSPNTPAWVTHLALRVDNLDALHEMKRRLQDAGVDVVGLTDHGFVRSIYFFDPNGIRVEFTTETATKAQIDQYAESAHRQLAEWTGYRAQQAKLGGAST